MPIDVPKLVRKIAEVGRAHPSLPDVRAEESSPLWAGKSD